MKTGKSFLAALLLIGSLGASGTAAAADRILLKEELTPGSNYCHMRFPAITEESLFTEHPVLKSSDSGDIIDFYGSCDENPLGPDQVAAQRRQYYTEQRQLPEGD